LRAIRSDTDILFLLKVLDKFIKAALTGAIDDDEDDFNYDTVSDELATAAVTDISTIRHLGVLPEDKPRPTKKKSAPRKKRGKKQADEAEKAQASGPAVGPRPDDLAPISQPPPSRLDTRLLPQSVSNKRADMDVDIPQLRYPAPPLTPGPPSSSAMHADEMQVISSPSFTLPDSAEDHVVRQSLPTLRNGRFDEINLLMVFDDKEDLSTHLAAGYKLIETETTAFIRFLGKQSQQALLARGLDISHLVDEPLNPIDWAIAKDKMVEAYTGGPLSRCLEQVAASNGDRWTQSCVELVRASRAASNSSNLVDKMVQLSVSRPTAEAKVGQVRPRQLEAISPTIDRRKRPTTHAPESAESGGTTNIDSQLRRAGLDLRLALSQLTAPADSSMMLTQGTPSPAESDGDVVIPESPLAAKVPPQVVIPRFSLTSAGLHNSTGKPSLTAHSTHPHNTTSKLPAGTAVQSVIGAASGSGNNPRGKTKATAGERGKKSKSAATGGTVDGSEARWRAHEAKVRALGRKNAEKTSN
jgi:hypothetical protein